MRPGHDQRCRDIVRLIPFCSPGGTRRINSLRILNIHGEISRTRSPSGTSEARIAAGRAGARSSATNKNKLLAIPELYFGAPDDLWAKPIEDVVLVPGEEHSPILVWLLIYVILTALTGRRGRETFARSNIHHRWTCSVNAEPQVTAARVSTKRPPAGEVNDISTGFRRECKS